MNIIFENISILDLVCITILITSSLWGYFRGFFREIFTLGVWIAAGWAALFFQQQILDIALGYFPTIPYLEFLVVPASFILFFLLFSLLVHPLSKLMRQFTPKLLDRGLGFFFGFGRAVLLLGLLWIVFLLVSEPEDFYRPMLKGFTVDFVHACARATLTLMEQINTQFGLLESLELQNFLNGIKAVISKFETVNNGLDI